MSRTFSRYFVVTFGCQANELDSEKIAALLETQGCQLARSKYKAEVVIINTCSVRQSAEDRVLGLVENLKKLKHKPEIIVTGCIVGSAEGSRKRFSLTKLKKRLPNIDQFVKIEDLLKEFKGEPKRKKKKSTFVSIMEGCDNFCSYCVVPYARGKEVSRKLEDVLCEVEQLAKKGYKQITLLGQNVNSYGKSGEGAEKSAFAKLLKRLHKIKGLEKISFLTSNPHDLSNDIIRALKLPKMDRYLHLPVQSGDDRVLKKMNRKYTAQKYLSLVKKIRKEIPEIKIGTDIIVGFPGETKKQFEKTLNLCKKAKFSKAYISKYSPREGTTAFKLKDDVPYIEKKRRWEILDKLINKK